MAEQEIEYIDPEKDTHLQDPESNKSDPEYYEYLKSVKASEGFDCDEPDDECIGCLKPIPRKLLGAGRYVKSGTFAVEEFNRLKGTNLGFQRVVRATSKMMMGFLYYLTLQCNDGRFYEAKVYLPFSFCNEPNILYIFRPAKHFSSNSDNSEESVSPRSSKSGCSDGSKSGGSDGSDQIRKKQKT